ncbi:MAG: DUF167 domain-containing protein [Deltaproteobacteria bacterium]|nr:DUF167 domain-containing protein [Deltaproteobacteria bacterium]MBW2077112.1 DUF167 domain-containing protein [Deltaproteobacteria bacterium]
MSDAVLKVTVLPRSSINKVVGFEGDTLKLKVKSAPVDGLANRDLIALLSKHLKIAKGRMEIVSGHSSRIKIIKFHDMSDDELLAALND